MPRKDRGRATYDDIVKLPDHVIGEILDGELFVSPRPAAPHANASSVLGGELVGAFHRLPGGSRGPGGWWVLDEPELHLHGDVLVPDLAGWRQERMLRLPNVAAFELPPDWVCEVVSPKTGRIDRARKMPIYARERVGHVFLVDPIERTFEIFRLQGEYLSLI